MASPVRFAIAVATAAFVSAPGLAAQDSAAADTRPGVAVLRFDNGGSHGPGAEAENFDALGVGLQQMLLTELGQNSGLRIVERGRIADLIQELNLQENDRLVDPATALQVGRLVQAHYVVLGSFADIFGQVRIDARIVDVETGEWETGAKEQGPRTEILTLIVDLADQLTRSVDLPPLPQQVKEEREEQSKQVPPEAFTEYSLALKLLDEGFRDEGMEQLDRVVDKFPDWEEPRQTLEKERSGV